MLKCYLTKLKNKRFEKWEKNWKLEKLAQNENYKNQTIKKMSTLKSTINEWLLYFMLKDNFKNWIIENIDDFWTYC